MTSKIFPLVFKSGIKRDNTHFQGDYVSSGDWIRWWQSYLRKIDGMTSYNLQFNMATMGWNVHDNVLNYFYITVSGNNLIIITVNARDSINYSVVNNNGSYISTGGPVNITQGVDVNITNTTLPQIIPVGINATTTETLFYFGNNLQNINNDIGNKNRFFKKLNISTTDVLLSADIQLTLDQDTSALSGGVTYNANYCFIYGSAGQVLVSALNNPYNYVNEGKGTSAEGSSFTIGTDKVIYGTSTRGSANNFTMLFWTLSTCVLVTSETPDPATGKTQLLWNKNIISKNISILSSRCVVECDGLFYWPGTDRFYVYNGMVQDLPNNMNQDYFFNNLDMSKRQLVYGVLNSEYKEIWWYYPEKNNTSDNYNMANAPEGLMLCTHALIYNIAEQTWYDSAITGTHGQYVPQLGRLFNLGLPKKYPASYNYLFTTNSSASNTTLNVGQGTNSLQRLLTGIATSNTTNTLDGNGGGVAANAFDNNYLTGCTQAVNGGNITYNYGNTPQIVKYVGLLFDDNNIDSAPYNINVVGFNDINAPQPITAFNNVILRSGVVYWTPLLANNVAYQYYQLQNLNNTFLSLSKIYLYSTILGDQEVVYSPIPSYYVTPIMSFASYSPLKENDGIDAFMQITRIEPDVKSVDYKDIKMSMQINTRVYAQSNVISSQVYNFTDSTPRITMYYQGRQVNFSISSTDFFEMGNWFFKAQKGAGQ